MKRAAVALLCAWMLMGCVVNETVDVQKRLEDHIAQAQNMQVQKASHSKKFYSYYLPKDIGRYESDLSGNLFCIDGVRVAMSLNTAAIINQRLYPSNTQQTVKMEGKTMVAYLNGDYLDIQEHAHPFQVGIFDLGNTYAVGLVSDTVLLQATCTALQTGVIAGRMLQIARSVLVDADQIVTYYSNQVPEISSQEKVELFDTQAPENGRIEELFEDHSRIDTPAPVDNNGQSSENSSGETE